jgi:hypothetical protein
MPFLHMQLSHPVTQKDDCSGTNQLPDKLSSRNIVYENEEKPHPPGSSEIIA